MSYILLTGATSDIGLAIATTLAKIGYSLLLTDYSDDALQLTLSKLPGKRHLALSIDLSNSETVRERLLPFMEEQHVSISAAVFAAGIFTMKPFKLLDQATILRDFNISLFSTIEFIQILSSKKINGDSLENIVMISSVSAHIGTKGYALYGSIKAALLGLAKSLSVELAPRVRINSVLPGGIRTRATEYIYASQTEPNIRYLLGEGKPQNIADMIQFLLSEKSSWITGQEFIVDGGLTSN